ncbi:MAG: hypothetical protein ACNA8W_06440 [Bradymonadaceae bacterium]
MAQKISRQVIGDPASFALDLRWLSKEPEDVRGLGWAGLYLWVNGSRVWTSGGRNVQPVLWTWLDLAEWLARAWPYILLEENAPFGLVASKPEELTQKKVLKTIKDTPAVEAADAIHAYLNRHDLAAGLKGIYLPSVWILPEGSNMRIRAANTDMWVAKKAVISIFEEFAEAILDKTGEDTTGRARIAREHWARRVPSRERVVELSTGLSLNVLKEWLPEVPEEKLVGDPVHGEETEFFAAARLSASLPHETRRQIVQTISTTAEMRERYGVSNEVLGWQIWNGPAKDLLQDREIKLIRKWCGI